MSTQPEAFEIIALTSLTRGQSTQGAVDDSVLSMRLTQAIKRINPATGKPWKQVDVVRAMAELNPPVEMTVGYFHDLLVGHRRAPSMKYIEAFAEVFDVPLTYFSNKSRQEQLSNLEERVVVEDAQAYELLLQYHQLSSEDKLYVINLVERLANGRGGSDSSGA